MVAFQIDTSQDDGVGLELLGGLQWEGSHQLAAADLEEATVAQREGHQSESAEGPSRGVIDLADAGEEQGRKGPHRQLRLLEPGEAAGIDTGGPALALPRKPSGERLRFGGIGTVGHHSFGQDGRPRTGKQGGRHAVGNGGHVVLRVDTAGVLEGPGLLRVLGQREQSCIESHGHLWGLPL